MATSDLLRNWTIGIYLRSHDFRPGDFGTGLATTELVQAIRSVSSETVLEWYLL